MIMLIDVVAMMLIFGVVLVVPTLLVHRWLSGPKQKALLKAEQSKEAGEVNEVKYRLRRSEICQVCGSQVDPVVDIYAGQCWYHANCYGKVN